MQHKCRVEVLEKKLFADYQQKYLADPKSGECPFYSVGDVTLFERYGGEDTFWTMAKGAHCSEAWDCISRYVYAALQGGAVMRGWTNDERVMIACCNDGTRPVIFKIERIDYKVLYIDGIDGKNCRSLLDGLMEIENVTNAVYREEKGFTELFVDRDIPDEVIAETVKAAGNFKIVKID
ncbi:MAG: TIGR04076 family protein [Prevotella sp.]|nr:TIGR04076 family protein [Prevotella sp.]